MGAKSGPPNINFFISITYLQCKAMANRVKHPPVFGGQHHQLGACCLFFVAVYMNNVQALPRKYRSVMLFQESDRKSKTIVRCFDNSVRGLKPPRFLVFVWY
jgi:hypothetical protein